MWVVESVVLVSSVVEFFLCFVVDMIGIMNEGEGGIMREIEIGRGVESGLDIGIGIGIEYGFMIRVVIGKEKGKEEGRKE